jgi:hypothetical protein
MEKPSLASDTGANMSEKQYKAETVADKVI